MGKGESERAREDMHVQGVLAKGETTSGNAQWERVGGRRWGAEGRRGELERDRRGGLVGCERARARSAVLIAKALRPAPPTLKGDEDVDKRSRGALGDSFGAFFEAFRGRLGGSWGSLRASGGLLGSSWGLLRGCLGASGGPLGASEAEGSKCPFGSLVWAPSWSRLGNVFGCLGGLLGGRGAILEAFWAILVRPWGPLGLSWNVGKLTRRECRNLSKT